MSITAENITKETFREAMKELSPIIDGSAKEIAKTIGIHHSTYQYYLYDDCADTAQSRKRMWQIYNAAVKFSTPKKEEFLTALSHIS